MENASAEIKEIYKTRVESLGLTNRAEKALKNGGVRTIGGIIRKGESGLLELNGMGVKCTREILDKVERYKQANIESTTPAAKTENRESQYIDVKDAQPSDIGRYKFELKLDDDDDIVAILAEHFSFSKEIIESHTRKKEIVRARDFIIYLLREYADMSYPVIGKLLGGRDHTTVIHAHKKIKRLIDDNPYIGAEIAGLVEKVKSVKEKKEHIENVLIPEILAEVSVQTEIKSRVPKFKEIPERDLKILEMFREGITLRNISAIFGVTHERVRQIVLKTIRQSAVNESVSKGILLDYDIVLEEELKRRKSAKDKVKPPKIRIEKQNRWSRYYIACKSCGQTTYPHVKKGLCEKCVGNYRDERRDDIIKEHGDKCDSCGISRMNALAAYGRDFYITKEKLVYCQKCFRQITGKILGESTRKRRYEVRLE